MLDYKYVATIDHDWSLCVITGKLGDVYFDGIYAIIHDEDAISAEFWEDLDKVVACIISKKLGKRLETYYE